MNSSDEQKLADCKANPTVRPGMEKLPKEVIEKQQQTRIRHLEKETHPNGTAITVPTKDLPKLKPILE